MKAKNFNKVQTFDWDFYFLRKPSFKILFRKKKSNLTVQLRFRTATCRGLVNVITLTCGRVKLLFVKFPSIIWRKYSRDSSQGALNLFFFFFFFLIEIPGLELTKKIDHLYVT